jgi:hypothetical protein
MEILVFGLSAEDSILSQLRNWYPEVGFRKFDVSDELGDADRRIIAIDTVQGLSQVTLLDDISSVSPGRALEGSGALITLRILLRIGSIDSARVIGIPPGYPVDKSVTEIAAIIGELSKEGD